MVRSGDRFTLTLTGAPSADITPVGAKALAVFPGGRLEHGKVRTSWTRLAETIPAAATSAKLQGEVDRKPGDRIVIALPQTSIPITPSWSPSLVWWV